MQQEGTTVFNLYKEDSVMNTNDAFVKRYGDVRKETTVGFQRANWDIAYKNKIARSNRYYKGQEVKITVDLEHFKMYGPGVFLFFTFLKKLSILLLIMSLISLLPIIYNFVVGSNYSNVGTSLQVYVGKLSVGNQIGPDSSLTFSEQVTKSRNNKLMNAIPDMVNCVLLFLFYFYWLKKSTTLTEEIKKEIKLPNYFTVQVSDFPDNTTQSQMQEYMKRFGAVKEVAAVCNYDEMISLSRKIYDISLNLKEIKLTASEGDNYQEKLKEKEKQIEELYAELSKEQIKGDERIIKFYVSFETTATREQVLKDFKPHLDLIKCCRKQPEDKFLLKGQVCKIVACTEQPTGILWENAHITWKTRWIRSIIQALVLIFLISVGFLLIALMNISSPPLNNNSIDTTNYTTTTILTETDSLILQSWCLKNTASALSTTALSEICQKFITRYYTKVAIGVGISVGIIIIKLILKIIVVSLAKFQRYKTRSEQSKDTIINLFVTYTCTTVLIVFLLQANVFKISFKTVINAFIRNQYLKENLGLLKEYLDFNGNWYIDIGYQIWLTWLIMAFSPHMYMPIVHWLFEKWNQYKAQKEVLQKNMEKRIEAQQFPFQDNYANISMILFVCITFCGGIPLLLPVTFLAILTKYLYFKYAFIRFCRVPKTFDDSINNKITTFIPIALFFHFAFTIWMYGVKEHFMFQQSWASSYMKTVSSSFIRNFMIVFERLINTWYLTVLWALLFTIMFFKTIIYDLIAKTFISESQKVPESVLTAQNQGAVIRSQRSLTTSYKLQNNPDYFQILAIMNPKKVNHTPTPKI